jgi:hypothetical protein
MSWQNQPRDSKGRFLPKGSRPQSQKKQTKHALRGPDGRFISSNQQPQVEEQLTHVAIILDASSSMSSIKGSAMEMFNTQLMNLRAESFRTKQATKISTYTFTTTGYWSGRERIVITPIDLRQFPEATQMLNDATYQTNGNTPLVSAVARAIADFQALPEASDPNTSFLLIVVTDGEENRSEYHDKMRIPGQIAQLQATGRWTFTFSVPMGHTNYITHFFGVPAGNVQEWEQTRQGTERLSRTVESATTIYYDSRAKGERATRSFFADLSGVKEADLQNKLDDMSKQFKKWQIDKGEQAITNFVDGKLSNANVAKQVGHGQYRPGHAYYELTKPENLQSYKDVVIMDRDSGKIYGGTEARAILGAGGGDQRVKIKNLATYRVFVQSTSSNRKLVRGTTLLYKKSK